MAPFYGWGSAASRIQNLYKEAVYFLPLSSQKFLVNSFDQCHKDERLSQPRDHPVVNPAP